MLDRKDAKTPYIQNYLRSEVSSYTNQLEGENETINVSSETKQKQRTREETHKRANNLIPAQDEAERKCR